MWCSSKKLRPGFVHLFSTWPTIRDLQYTGHLAIGVLGRDCVFVENQATFFSENLTVAGAGLMEVDEGTVNVIETMEIEPLGEVNISGVAFGNLFTKDLINSGNLFIDRQRTVFVTGTYFDQASGFTGPGTLFISGIFDSRNAVDAIQFGGDLVLGDETILEISLADDSSDQLVVSDNLFVNGILTLEYENVSGLDRNEFLIIADVSGSRLGTFENLAEGDQILHDGIVGLFITYVAGDGNDIALYGGPAELDFVADRLNVLRGIVLIRWPCNVPGINGCL